jgi:myo-inositol-1(or 4)-monophosphatase
MPLGHEQRHPRPDPTELDLALLREIEVVAQTAATFIRSHDAERASLAWDIKGESDFVSAVDRGTETIIRDHLAPPGRDVTFIGEESAPDASIAHGITFIVDPLDGTTNYLHGFPAYAVSIGAMVDGELAAAVVVDVPRHECYTAVRNGGAFRDGQPMRVSVITDPALSLIATGVPFRKPEQIARYLAQLPKVLATTSGIRRAGAAAIDLAHVACGRVDAFWELRLAPWDVAAGILLVREAGGVVTDFSGAPSTPAFSGYVAGNPAMHAWLLRTIS